jgi:hypothetical protein
MRAAKRTGIRRRSVMPTLELFMLGFIIVVAAIGVGWFIYDSRSDEEK